MWLIRGVFGHRKNFVKKRTEIHFSIFIENRNWDLKLVFNLIMKTKNERKSNFYFILKQKSNVPFDPGIYNPCTESVIQFSFYGKNHFCVFQFRFKIENWKMIKIFQFSISNFYWKTDIENPFFILQFLNLFGELHK